MSEIGNYIFNMGLYQYLILALCLFLVGLFTFILSHDIVKMIISLFFIFNSVCINFLAFSSHLNNKHYIGEAVNILIALVFVCQLIAFLAICINIYSSFISNGSENIKESSK